MDLEGSGVGHGSGSGMQCTGLFVCPTCTPSVYATYRPYQSCSTTLILVFLWLGQRRNDMRCCAPRSLPLTIPWCSFYL